jgi:hypothetical protein
VCEETIRNCGLKTGDRGEQGSKGGEVLCLSFSFFRPRTEDCRKRELRGNVLRAVVKGCLLALMSFWGYNAGTAQMGIS